MLVIGIGNRYRSDDGAGPAALELLRIERLPGVRLLECEGEASSLLDAWQGAGAVVLIDAASSHAAPGTIYRFDLLAQPLPFEVSQAIELGRVLHQLPTSLILYAIEGKSFAAGTGLSREVALAVHEVVQHLKRELA